MRHYSKNMLNPTQKKGICLTFEYITRIKEENVGLWRNLLSDQGMGRKSKGDSVRITIPYKRKKTRYSQL